MNYVLIVGKIKKVDKTKSYCNGICKLRFYVDTKSSDIIPAIYENDDLNNVEELEKELYKGRLVAIKGKLKYINNKLMVLTNNITLNENTCN